LDGHNRLLWQELVSGQLRSLLNSSVWYKAFVLNHTRSTKSHMAWREGTVFQGIHAAIPFIKRNF
jgi:hypothetical protein